MRRIVILLALSFAAGWFWFGADRSIPSNPQYGAVGLSLCVIFLLVAGVLSAFEWRKQIAEK